MASIYEYVSVTDIRVYFNCGRTEVGWMASIFFYVTYGFGEFSKMQSKSFTKSKINPALIYSYSSFRLT